MQRKIYFGFAGLIFLSFLSGCIKKQIKPFWPSIEVESSAAEETMQKETMNTEHESESLEESRELTAEEFYFIESAFECGKDPEKSRLLAVVNTSDDTSEIKLIAVCRETGDEIVLTDDGRGADSIAGDHVFFGETIFSSNEEKVLTYALQAESDKIVVSAPDADVKFYTLESYYTEIDKINEIERELDRISEGFVCNEDEGIESAAKEYLETAGKIEDYLKGLVTKGDIEAYEWNFPEFMVHFSLGSFAYSFGDFGDGILDGGSDIIPNTKAESNDSEEKGGILLLLPYGTELDSRIAPTMQESVEELAGQFDYPLTIRSYTEVNKDVLTSFDDYHIIVIMTHGGFSKKHGPVFVCGIPYEDMSQKDYTNRRLIPDDKKKKVLVTPKFFDYYYQNKSLYGSLFFIGACHGADNSRLADALINRGANAVLGFKNSVFTYYTESMFHSIITDLMEEDEEYPGLTNTISHAVETAKHENGAKSPGRRDKGEEIESFGDFMYYLYLNLYDKIEGRAELILREWQDRAFMSPFRLIKEDNSESESSKAEVNTDEKPENDFYEALYAVKDHAAVEEFVEANGLVMRYDVEGEAWGYFDPNVPEYPIMSIGSFSLDGRYYASCNGPCGMTLCGIEVGDEVSDLEEAMHWYGKCIDIERETINDSLCTTIYLSANDGLLYNLRYTQSGETITSWYVYLEAGNG